MTASLVNFGGTKTTVASAPGLGHGLGDGAEHRQRCAVEVDLLPGLAGR